MVLMRHTCRYRIHGCGDPLAANHVPYSGREAYSGILAESIFVHNQSLCQYAGCNDSEAANFDSRVRLRQSIASAEKTKDDGVRLVLDGTLELEGSERPAVVAQTIRLIYP